MGPIQVLMIVIAFGMVARALWMLALIGKTVWDHRDKDDK